MSITDKIRQVRTSKQYSQEFMAGKMGLTQRAYSKIENGEIKLDIPKLQQIANVLDVDAGELLSAGEAQANNFSNNKITNAVVNHFNSENNKFKAEVLDIIKNEISYLKEQLSQKDKQIAELMALLKK